MTERNYAEKTFDSVLAEGAYVVASHGSTEMQVVGSEIDGPWQAIVRVSRQILIDLGEDGDAWTQRLVDEDTQNVLVTDCEFHVWIIEAEPGSMSIQSMCNVDWMPDKVMVMDRDFEAVASHYCKEV